MKKSRLIVVGSILLAVILALSGVIVLTTGAEEGEPSVTIAAQNLAFKDSVYLVYAVKTENAPSGAEKGLLLWLTCPDTYTYESAEVILTDSSPERLALNEVEGDYDVYEYHGLAARQMADTVYAVAYIKNGESEYYSAPMKYSILQYVYNKTGKTGPCTEVANLPELLEQMLDYGAAAQTYTDYKADRLANDDWYQILVNGGTVEDGFNHGLYLTGDEITLTAPAEKDGQAFSYWKNSADETVGTEATLTVTVGDQNETYIAVYDSIQEDEHHVKFVLKSETAIAGEEVEIELSVQSKTGVTVDGLLAYQLTYDNTSLEFIGFTSPGSLVTDSAAGINSINNKNKMITLGYGSAIEANGTICKLKFKVKDTVASNSDLVVSMNVSASKNRLPIDGSVLAPSCVITVISPS